ncbi:hypothetical protein CMQ_684 [Grosmannia clavigera kw1407]|uniref:Uncharacterized protein n=1 Tax=Grosmannia clavigera (strain kw1407 / UAMH 11150) TaxID=655863 RepID=F0XCD6_GROCL|nr:uncharacterized protein CMQ_684 [Grosmannia clavigera kw1407]EFX03756.1 hypothetical protein CMQ_684 [Grosmannia clavigera kw1407]
MEHKPETCRPRASRRPGAKLYQNPVVEAAPSHDGSPIFTAYTTDEYDSKRPLFALVVYVTVAEASDPSYVRDLALQIHKGMGRERRAHMIRDYRRDRIELVGVPEKRQRDDGESESDKTCVARCQTHYLAEVASRMATGESNFFLPPTFDPTDYTRRPTVIRRLCYIALPSG